MYPQQLEAGISALFQCTAKDQMVWAALGHVLLVVNWFTLKGKTRPLKFSFTVYLCVCNAEEKQMFRLLPSSVCRLSQCNLF